MSSSPGVPRNRQSCYSSSGLLKVLPPRGGRGGEGLVGRWGKWWGAAGRRGNSQEHAAASCFVVFRCYPFQLTTRVVTPAQVAVLLCFVFHHPPIPPLRSLVLACTRGIPRRLDGGGSNRGQRTTLSTRGRQGQSETHCCCSRLSSACWGDVFSALWRARPSVCRGAPRSRRSPRARARVPVSPQGRQRHEIG